MPIVEREKDRLCLATLRLAEVSPEPELNGHSVSDSKDDILAEEGASTVDVVLILSWVWANDGSPVSHAGIKLTVARWSSDVGIRRHCSVLPLPSLAKLGGDVHSFGVLGRGPAIIEFVNGELEVDQGVVSAIVHLFLCQWNFNWVIPHVESVDLADERVEEPESWLEWSLLSQIDWIAHKLDLLSILVESDHGNSSLVIESHLEVHPLVWWQVDSVRVGLHEVVICEDVGSDTVL